MKPQQLTQKLTLAEKTVLLAVASRALAYYEASNEADYDVGYTKVRDSEADNVSSVSMMHDILPDYYPSLELGRSLLTLLDFRFDELKPIVKAIAADL